MESFNPFRKKTVAPDPRLSSKERRAQEKSRREFLGNVGAGVAALSGTGAAIGAGLAGNINDLSERTTAFEKVHDAVQVQGHPFRLIGILHTLPEFQKLEPKIRERIRKAPFVILEYFDPKYFKDSPSESPQEQVEELKLQANRYFAAMGALCAEEGKDIVVVNPETPTARVMDTFLTFGLPVGAGYKALSDVDNYTMTSRRGFLLGATALPLGAAALSELGVTRAIRDSREEPNSEHVQKNERADIYGWHISDWRDLVTAKGVELASKAYGQEIQPGQEVPMYHGASHIGVIEYLKRPEFREEKEAGYVLHGLAGNLSLRRYHYDPVQRTWEESDTKNI